MEELAFLSTYDLEWNPFCNIKLTGALLNLQISGDEISFLTGGDDPYDDNVVLEKLFHPKLKVLIVSEGSKGCRYYTKVFICMHRIESKDRIGITAFAFKLKKTKQNWMHIVFS